MSLIPLSRRAGSTSLIVRAYLRRGLLRLPKEEPTGVLQFMGGGSHRYNYRQYISPSKPLFGKKTDESIITNNEEFLLKSWGFNKDQLEKTATRNILTLENGVLEERVNWLKERLNLKKKSDIKKITQKQPSVLGMLSDTNLAPKLDYLQKRLRLNEKSLRKLVLDAPAVLSLSVEDNIEPKLDHLQKKLELSDSALSKMVQRYPQILGLSIEDNIEPKLDWLQKRLDLDETALIKLFRDRRQFCGILFLTIWNQRWAGFSSVLT